MAINLLNSQILQVHGVSRLPGGSPTGTLYICTGTAFTELDGTGQPGILRQSQSFFLSGPDGIPFQFTSGSSRIAQAVATGSLTSIGGGNGTWALDDIRANIEGVLVNVTVDLAVEPNNTIHRIEYHVSVLVDS